MKDSAPWAVKRNSASPTSTGTPPAVRVPFVPSLNVISIRIDPERKAIFIMLLAAIPGGELVSLRTMASHQSDSMIVARSPSMRSVITMTRTTIPSLPLSTSAPASKLLEMATFQPNRSADLMSAAASLKSCWPVLVSKWYAEPEKEAESESERAPTITVGPEIATE